MQNVLPGKTNPDSQNFYYHANVVAAPKILRIRGEEESNGGRAWRSGIEEVLMCMAHRKQKELELELIQTQMTQKPMLRAEVYARALRASHNRKENSV